MSAALLAHLEQRLSEETTAQVGTLLPHPASATDAQLDAIEAQLKAMRGRVAMVPTMADSWEEGAPAPKGDWRAERLGANPPQTLPVLRLHAHRAILAAGGINGEALLEAAPAAASREAWRQYLHGFVGPLAAEVAAQLGPALDTPGLAFSFDGLFASDMMGRARAVASLVNAGATLASASRIAGFSDLEAAPDPSASMP